jgi:hypothetical protein
MMRMAAARSRRATRIVRCAVIGSFSSAGGCARLPSFSRSLRCTPVRRAFTARRPRRWPCRPRCSHWLSSRWLLQLRCATAAGRRIATLPERGVQVDAVRFNLNTHEGRVAGTADRPPWAWERSASPTADPAPLSLRPSAFCLCFSATGRRGRQPLRAATTRRRGRLSAPPAAPSADSAVAAAAAARRNQPTTGDMAARYRVACDPRAEVGILRRLLAMRRALWASCCDSRPQQPSGVPPKIRCGTRRGCSAG